jgi:hypothetical protein
MSSTDFSRSRPFFAQVLLAGFDAVLRPELAMVLSLLEGRAKGRRENPVMARFFQRKSLSLTEARQKMKLVHTIHPSQP